MNQARYLLSEVSFAMTNKTPNSPCLHVWTQLGRDPMSPSATFEA